MNNIAYIYQPHFMSNAFRVALNDQRGVDYNYIIVTCSPRYNGVYRYTASNIVDKLYPTWSNKKRLCVCVPIVDCEKRGELTDIRNEDIINRVRKMQQNWLDNEVENTEHKYQEKPDWML